VEELYTMFAAQLQSKLNRSEEDMEDLLTSNVFGTWRYLDYRLGLIQFLETATRLDGQKLNLKNIKSLEIEFWPWLGEVNAKRAQPDVMIKLKHTNSEMSLVLIESKYLFGKSSSATPDGKPNDQLAREMDNLRRLASRTRIQNYYLLYVTAHTLLPKWDIQNSINELKKKTGDGAEEHFYWTTWRELPRILKTIIKPNMAQHELMIVDLMQILNKMGLMFFQGINKQIFNAKKINWEFTKPTRTFTWRVINIPHYHFMEQ
jgi:hypothetical protein